MLIEGIFSQHIIGLSWLVAIGQFAAGLAIFTGTLTSAALISAVFLNINFMLAGRVNPSAFYLMMELVLLQSKAGQLWGLDAWLKLKVRLLAFYPRYIKTSYYTKHFLQSKHGVMTQIALYGGVSLAFVPFMTSIGFISCLQVIGLFKDIFSFLPCVNLEGFVEDPAMFLSLLYRVRKYM